MIARLEWEVEQIARAHEGHEERLAEAAEVAREASASLSQQENLLSQATEDAARLAARHQSVQRLLADSRATVQKAESEAARAAEAALAAETALATAAEAYAAAEEAQGEAAALAEEAEETLLSAEEARGRVQGREAEARAAKSEAEGEASALRAEVAALTKLVQREAQAGQQLLDLLVVQEGLEKAIGAALADDLRAPEVAGDRASGWVALPEYPEPVALPDGVEPLSDYVGAPGVLARRMGQIGLVARAAGARLQAALQPGQRLVSREGDLWRWDGFRAGAEDAPSAAALRLQQLNRLTALKRDLEEVAARAEGAAQAHASLQARLADLARADQMAREARRAADTRVAEAGRMAARAEADKSIAGGKLEAARLAVSRYTDESEEARARLEEAMAGAEDLPDLDAARAALETAKVAVEAARITMMSRRSGHDEVRREGEARVRRQQDAVKEIAGWKHRLETAGKRLAELAARKAETEEELVEAAAAPEEIAIKREELSEAIAEAEARRALASDALSAGEGALRGARDTEREGERLAGEAREARARSEARAEAARETVTAAAVRISEEAGATPDQLLDTLKVDPDKMPDADSLDTDVQRLKRQREALGAVNLRAEEDAKEIGQTNTTRWRRKRSIWKRRSRSCARALRA